jgi:hypothetical protein
LTPEIRAVRMNSLHLLGTVHRPPVYFCTEQGRDLCRLVIRSGSLAENSLAYHHCTAWGPAALSLHTYLSKGSKLAIIGQLRYRKGKPGTSGMHRRPYIHIQSFRFTEPYRPSRSACRSVAVPEYGSPY